MDEVWLFLKDYPGIVPGVEGKRGVNTPVDMREVTPEDQEQARMPYRSLGGVAGGLMGGLTGAVVGGPLGAVAGAGLGAGIGGLMGHAALPMSVRQRQAQFQAQQRKLIQQNVDWLEHDKRVQSGTARHPKGWETGPKFELGRQQYNVLDHIWKPGQERQLLVGKPGMKTTRCKKCDGSGKHEYDDIDYGTVSMSCDDCGGKGKITKPRTVFPADKPDWLKTRKYPVPGRTIFGPGGYMEGVDDWFQTMFQNPGSGDKDKAAADKAAFLDKKFRKHGWLSNDEMKWLQNWYASMSPYLIGGAADRLGLLRQKKEKASKEEKAEAAETEADDKAAAAARLKNKKVGKISTGEVVPEWHEDFSGWGIDKDSGGYSKSAHNVLPDTYGDKMKLAHGKEFEVEPPVSGEWELDDFVRQKLFGGHEDASKYWTTMKKVMPFLNQENMVKWLRSHPGWEDKIPDDFEWKDLDKLKERLMKRERRDPPPRSGGGAVAGRPGIDRITGSDDSIHQVEPSDLAWAVLKLG